MPKAVSLPRHPPAAPVIIAIDGITAGLALRDNSRFRFFSGHPRFDLLDGSRFSHVEDVRWAVKRLAHATKEEARQASAPAERQLQDLEV